MTVIRHREKLGRFADAVETKRVKVGFLGGSITAEDPAVGGQEYNWPSCVRGHLLQKYPDVYWEFYNTAIGGTGSLSGLIRVQKEIIDRGCDLVFVEYAVNDTYGERELRKLEEEGLLRRLLKNGIDVVLVYTFCTSMYPALEKGEVPDDIARWEQLAEHYGIASVWSGLYAYRQLCEGKISWEGWLPVCGGTLHPGEAGSMLYAQPVIEFLEDELQEKGAQQDKKKLPAPTDARNFENLKEIPMSEWGIMPPWTVLRELQTPWFDRVCYTAADGARLSLRFKGRMLACCMSFGKRSGVLHYSIDGGETVVYRGNRCEWVPDKGWCIPELLAHDLAEGEHVLELTVRYEPSPECKGTECRIFALLTADY